MILVTSDTHSCYDYINKQIEYAEGVLCLSIACVVHLGDFGIFRTDLYDFFNKQKKRFSRPVYFIEGNHEDFDALPWLTKKYKEHFTHLSRGSVHSLAGYKFLCLGGAAYMDSMITQRAAIISERHINECLSIEPEHVDIILTHDCPVGIGVPNSPGLEHYGQTGFPRSDELAEHFRPKLWLFGHHHKWFEYRDGQTTYYGLPEIWKGFGLLDGNYQFKMVEHPLQKPEKETSLIDRFLIKLKIINR